jgi:hypothetical protein
MLPQAVHQQTQRHNESQCHNPLRGFEENTRSKKQRVFKKAKTPLNPLLLLVVDKHLLIAQRGFI